MSNKVNKKALTLLFDRPLEPIFTTKDNGKAAFVLPKCFYNEKYIDVKEDIQSRFSKDIDEKIPLKDLEQKPDLSFTLSLENKCFSLFNRVHRSIEARLIEIFMTCPDLEQFIATCVYCKDRVNPFLFQYCYSVALQHRKDTSNFPLKPIAETFPQSFIEPNVFKEARAEAEIVCNPRDRVSTQSY